MDQVDWSLLSELQTDARLSYNALSRRIHMSPPAVAERVRRLEEGGLVTGYHAHVDLAQVGWSVVAIVLMSCYGSRCILRDPEILAWPKILEIHRVTGNECCILKVVGTSLADYEHTIDRLGQAGQPTSMLVLSSPLPWRQIQPPG